ncbi:MAG: type I polyketide synthase, partial [Blastocatellia bacterium]
MTDAVDTGCDIAIVGMACRFPGASNIAEFWEKLTQGVELLTSLTDDELLAAGAIPALMAHPAYVKSDGYLSGIELFDASFFGYTPREAEMMDPQIRVFLEVAWEAMENAGYSRDRLLARTGVFAGASVNTYILSNLYPNHGLIDAIGSFQSTILNNRDYLPLHVSYKLDLNGPSINVQTACSTSLVAVHLGCQSLLGRESDLVLAGGASIRVPQGLGYLYQEGGILSRDGRCRAFDSKASGTIASSGAGAVVLKRLDDAIAGRDHIYALIRGTAVNNDGAVKAGFTTPAVDGQSAVIQEALAVAMVSADTVTYVETHGTGTPLGDPIEIASLTDAFQKDTNRQQFCRIGSVKTNLGHLDAAAGVAGLIKTALALHHRQIPPSLHFESPNPEIQFDTTPFFVNTSLCDWDHSSSPLRAGVSSFGIGGTNAHAILEEAPIRSSGSQTHRPAILTLSAKSENALNAASLNLADFLSSCSGVNIADAAYSLQVGRRVMAHRRVVICNEADQASNLLKGAIDGGVVLKGFWDRGNRPVAFVFPGQGAQYPGMSSELYEQEPVFRSQTKRNRDCASNGLRQRRQRRRTISVRRERSLRRKNLT